MGFLEPLKPVLTIALISTTPVSQVMMGKIIKSLPMGIKISCTIERNKGVLKVVERNLS